MTTVTEWDLLVKSEPVPKPYSNMEGCNCQPYWDYADEQWEVCYGSVISTVLIAVRIVVIVGLIAVAFFGCVTFSVKFKRGLVRVDTVQAKA